jgi:hypothetical protein
VARFGSQDLETVKAVWQVYEREGQEAGMEALIEASDEAVEFRPYGAGDAVLRGAEELRAFYARTANEGAKVEAKAYEFGERDGAVVVEGWVRVTRAGGGLADAQVRWVYTFRDGKITRAVSEPASVAA